MTLRSTVNEIFFTYLLEKVRIEPYFATECFKFQVLCELPVPDVAASEAAAYKAVNPPREFPATTHDCPDSSFTYIKKVN